MSNRECSVCGVEFTCGAEQEDETCWCNTFPAIMPTTFKKDCRCQLCLAQAFVEFIDESINLNGHKQLVEFASHYRNRGGTIEHVDYTIENGYYVFSKWYHLKRGACCSNGCRNCPY